MNKRIISLVLILAVMMTLIPIQSKAAGETGSVTVIKQNAAGTAGLAGAKFKIYTVQEGETDNTTANKTQYGTESAATGSNGTITFSNLPYGRYLIEESVTPSGVATAHANILVDVPTYTVNAGNVVVNTNPTVYVKNTVGVGDATLTFSDYITNSLKIQGLQFKLQRDGTDVAATDLVNADGTTATLSLTTNTSGQISLSNLPNGNYTLIQTATTSNYILDEKPITFTVTNGTTTYTNGCSATNTRYKPTITISCTQSGQSIADGGTINWVLTVKLPEASVWSRIGKFVVNTTNVAGVNAPTAANTIVKIGTGSAITSGVTKSGASVTIDTSTVARGSGDLTITYTSTVKKTGSTIGSTGNTIKGVVSYSQKIGTSRTTTGDYISTYAANSSNLTWYMYGYQCTKKDATGSVLQGATFMLATTNDKIVSNESITGAISIEGVSKFTSTATGIVQIDGLAAGTYYLYEVSAPTYASGSDTLAYKVLKDPIQITVNSTSNASSQMNIVNYKAVTLPVTGGVSYIGIVMFGLLLIAVGIRVSKKEIEKSNK